MQFESNGGTPLSMWIDDDGELFIKLSATCPTCGGPRGELDFGLDPHELIDRIETLIKLREEANG